MNHPTKIERQRVYQTYRKTFSGKNALVRTKKDILSIIEASSIVRPFTGKNSKRKTISVLKFLLENHVFELGEEAREELLESWLVLPEDSKTLVRCDTPHAERTKLEKVNKISPSRVNLHVSDIISHEEEISFPLNAPPPKFAYDAQHHVLATIQQILEVSCFNFTQTWLPSVFVKCAWSCAAALELTKWLQVMEEHLDALPEACIDGSGRATFRKIRPRLAHLRHSAVHRLHLGPDKVLEKVQAALLLSKILRDGSSISKLQAVHTQLQNSIAQTKHNTEAMQQEVNHTFLVIQSQREALYREEQRLRASAVESFSRIADAANQSLLGCMNHLLDARSPDDWSKKGVQCKDRTGSFDYGTYIDEDDIESDEDQLRADLG